MTRVDFYILKDMELPAMHRFACRLTCKAIDAGQQVVVHAADEASAREFDSSPVGLSGSAIHTSWARPLTAGARRTGGGVLG